MTEDPQLLRVLANLRARYLAEASGRVADLRAALARVEQGDQAGLGELRQLLHRLAGSGGAYGLQAVTDSARAAEIAVRAIQERGSPPGAFELSSLADQIGSVGAAFGEAGAST